jgi:hypothetical protein
MATSEQLLGPLRALRKALGKKDVAALRKVGSSAIEMTAVDDGEDTFYLALVAHMLSKLISKSHYWHLKEKRNFIAATLKKVEKCVKATEKNNLPTYSKMIKEIVRDMRELELTDPRYVHDLETKTRTKLASRLYAQGFSLSRAVAVTGTHKRDLLVYSGRTLIPDRSGKTKTLNERLKHMRKLFSSTVLLDGSETWSC